MKIIRCLNAADYEVDILGDPKITFQWSRDIRNCVIHKFPEPGVRDPNFEAMVASYIEDNDIDCVAADEVETQILINQMKDQLGSVACFPGMATKELELLNNKWAFNQLLSQNELRAPRSFVVRQASDVFGPDIRSLGFPFILKPLDKNGGEGIVKVASKAELEGLMMSGQLVDELPLLAQKYLAGRDGGFSFLAVQGQILGWTLQRYSPSKNVIEFFRSNEIEAFGTRFAELTNYTGLANIDLRLDDNYNLQGAIECNPRFWGSIIASRAYGLNFAKAGVDLALGANPNSLKVGDYREGKYFTARGAVKKCIANRGTLNGIDRENIRELGCQAADILPYLYRRANNLWASFRGQSGGN